MINYNYIVIFVEVELICTVYPRSVVHRFWGCLYNVDSPSNIGKK